MNIKLLRNISIVGMSLCCVTIWANQQSVKNKQNTSATTSEPAVKKPVKETATGKSAQPSSKPSVKNGQAKKTAPQPAKSEKIRLDGIQSVVFGKEATTIITESDLRRPGLDGSLRSLDDIELEALMYQDATAKKMLPDEEAIDRHLNTVRKENNDMSLDQLKQVFKSAGYSYDEGRQQFKIMTAVNNVLDFMIRSRLLVPEKDVRAYYEAHPMYQEESYKVERAFVPFSATISKDVLYDKLVAYAHGTQPSFVIEWSTPFWVQENDLAQDKKFITSLNVGQISEPVEISGGFELFRLREKREYRQQPFEERYAEIAQELRKPRYEKLFDECKTSLFSASSIVRFDQ